MSGEHDYGPGGYLPERAAKRARKIVLREPLGKGWIVASVVGAVVMVVIAVAYLLVQAGPPGAPFRDVGPVEDFDPRGADVVTVDGTDALVVRGAGGIRVFRAPGVAVVWCRASGRIESPGGQVWEITGRLRGGEGTSLRPLRAEAHDGHLYVDPETQLDGPDEHPSGEEPVCVPG